MAQWRFGVDDLRLAAGPAYFERGQRYATQGHVGKLRPEPGGVSAMVGGSRNYLVQISGTSDGPRTSCTCPLGQEGESWCKHVVAVALSWVEAGHEVTAESAPEEEPDLAAFLKQQDGAWLTEQLLRVADDQPVVLARLQAAAGAPSAVATARDTLFTAIAEYLPDPDGWSSGDGGEEQLRLAIELLDDLMEYGYTEEAADLASDAYDLFDETHGGYEDEHSQRLDEIRGGDR